MRISFKWRGRFRCCLPPIQVGDISTSPFYVNNWGKTPDLFEPAYERDWIFSARFWRWYSEKKSSMDPPRSRIRLFWKFHCILQTVKDADLVIFIEMVPGHVPPTGPADRQRGLNLAKALYKMVDELKLINKVNRMCNCSTLVSHYSKVIKYSVKPLSFGYGWFN